MSDELGSTQPKQNNKVEEELVKSKDSSISFTKATENKQGQVIRRSVELMMTRTGPLPDPKTLAQYSRLIKNGADRIMQMAEKQQAHRMTIEKKVINGQLRESTIGQIFAFLLGLFALATATYCIVNGYEWSGSAIGIGGLTGLVTAFIKGKSQQQESLKEKNPIKQKEKSL